MNVIHKVLYYHPTNAPYTMSSIDLELKTCKLNSIDSLHHMKLYTLPPMDQCDAI
jgi:hypothetical protein